MAETAAATTTRPSRARTGTKAPAKATAAPAKVATPAATPEPTRIKIELELAGETKSYAKFVAPEGMKGTFVGQLYCPIGTERVIVMVIGAGDAGDE